MISRYQVVVDSIEKRNAICRLVRTFKRFGLVPSKTRMYVNTPGFPNEVDVIYAT